MKVTAIRQQDSLKGRYSVFVDGAYAFSLNADALLESKLVVGQELDEAERKGYQQLGADSTAYNLALQYMLRRTRSHGELHDYFRRKGYGERLRQYISGRLERQGLLNDEKFAEAWVRNRRLLKPISMRRLAAELRQKRVAEDIIERVLAQDEANEANVLRELIARRRKQPKYQDDLKLMQYLARQGFSYDDIKEALNDQRK